MIKVTCTAAGCANENVEYNMDDTAEYVICGGCKNLLKSETFDWIAPEYPPEVQNKSTFLTENK